jgi:Family of unknown function (DUF6292)
MISELATVAAVGKTARRISDHGPYIHAVAAALAERDIVAEVSVVSAELDFCREAVLDLRADQSAFDQQVPDQAVGFWDENSGWSLTITRGDRETEFFEGTQLVPDPDAVAAWMVIGLTHPGLEAASGGAWFREAEEVDPEFEAQLARYSPDQ